MGFTLTDRPFTYRPNVIQTVMPATPIRSLSSAMSFIRVAHTMRGSKKLLWCAQSLLVVIEGKVSARKGLLNPGSRHMSDAMYCRILLNILIRYQSTICHNVKHTCGFNLSRLGHQMGDIYSRKCKIKLDFPTKFRGLGYTSK